MSDTHGANRIELECQVLCSALRSSWAGEDITGRVKSCMELSQLFPDLLTELDPAQPQPPRNHYDLLGVSCDASPRKVIIAYFRHAKKFLRQHNPRQKRMDYFQLLDAGFMLRKPRLRLSHDLIVSRTALIDSKLIPKTGVFEFIGVAPVPIQPSAPSPMPVQAAPSQPAGQPISVPPQPAQPISVQSQPQPAQPISVQSQPQPAQPISVQPQPAQPISVQSQPQPGQPISVQPPEAPSVPQPQPQQPQPQALPVPPAPPAAPRLPAVVELLRAANLIGGPEVQALTNQMRYFPGVPVWELILGAGYVTESEMKSVQLGEFLLGQGKINIGQFSVAMYDERSTGVKMAESLQARGWLKGD